MTYGILTAPIIVTNAKNLNDLVLHDETIQVDDLVFDETAHTLVIPARRQFHGGKESVLSSDEEWTIYEKDWMQSELLIRNVNHWQLIDDQQIGEYTFNRCEYGNFMLRIHFCEISILEVFVSKLEVIMTDIGFNGKARIERKKSGTEISTHCIY